MAVRPSKYEKLGVDPGKSNVRKIFKSGISNDFPGAFVNIVKDPEYSNQVFTQHMDGDGSKFVQRLLVYKEKGDIGVIQGAVDDAVSMNLGDIAASGFVFGKIVVTDVININGSSIPKNKIMKQIAIRFNHLIELHRKYGFNIHFLGGETADLPDQVSTCVFDVAVYARAKKTDIISGNVMSGDKIYGFASNGRAVWENEDNSGIMSNGLTLARISSMWQGYSKKYPLLIRADGSYEGKYKVGKKADLLKNVPVSTALISPTRQWAILIKLLLEKLKEKNIFNMLHGISMNTGGGATKIRHVGKNILYEKRMPKPPSIFQLIQKESGESWKDMFIDFNCGIGIDIVGKNDPKFETVLHEIANDTNVRCFELGICKSNKKENKVILETPYGLFDNY